VTEKTSKTKAVQGGDPETPRQAVEWETAKRRYLGLGLCLRCASQAAWGHQCGFSQIHPPCDDCRGTALPTDDYWFANRSERAARWLGSPIPGPASKLQLHSEQSSESFPHPRPQSDSSSVQATR
jgi:hypothetical protein